MSVEINETLQEPLDLELELATGILKGDPGERGPQGEQGMASSFMLVAFYIHSFSPTLLYHKK